MSTVTTATGRRKTSVARIQLKPGEGILIEQVVPGSLAVRMGVKRLDVIRMANGLPVGSAPDLRKVLQGIAKGGVVELDVIRAGDPLALQGTR